MSDPYESITWSTNNDASAGNEFKLLYGNYDKASLASRRSKYLFSELDDRPEIENILIKQGEDTVSCQYPNGGTCASVGYYSIETDNDTEEYKYVWSILSGNASIVGSVNDSIAVVQTTASNTDEAFTLNCIVSEDKIGSTTLSSTFTHYKTEL